MHARVRLLGLLVMASFFASTTAFARVQYLCRMTGNVGAPCPCAHAHKRAPAQVPSVRTADCCEAKVLPAGERVASAPAPRPELPAAALLPSPPVIEPPRLVPTSCGFAPRRSRAPPGPTVPVYLRNCSFLD